MIARWIVGIGMWALAMGSAAHAQSPAPPRLPKYVNIEGAEHPELIPQWMLWEHTFRNLAISKAKNLTAFLDSLKVSPEDADLIYAEAARYTERENRCYEGSKRLWLEIKTEPRAEVRE